MARHISSVIALAAAVLALPAPSSPSDSSPWCGVGQYSHQPPPATRRARAGDVALGLSVESSGPGDPVRWVLALRNRTRDALGLYFRDSHYANVVVWGPGTAYSWGRRPAQNATWRFTLGPAETYVCKLAPDALPVELPAGRYQLIAYLTTADIRVETRRSLIVAAR